MAFLIGLAWTRLLGGGGGGGAFGDGVLYRHRKCGTTT